MRRGDIALFDNLQETYLPSLQVDPELVTVSFRLRRRRVTILPLVTRRQVIYVLGCLACAGNLLPCRPDVRRCWLRCAPCAPREQRCHRQPLRPGRAFSQRRHWPAEAWPHPRHLLKPSRRREAAPPWPPTCPTPTTWTESQTENMTESKTEGKTESQT